MQTQVSTVTKTKLVIATGVAFIAAGGAALAGLPWLVPNESDLNKTDIHAKLTDFCADNVCQSVIDDCFNDTACAEKLSGCLYWWTMDQCSGVALEDEFVCRAGVVESCLIEITGGPITFNLKNPDFNPGSSGCQDSDSGVVGDVKGEVITPSEIRQDSCDSDTQVMEWFCDANGEMNREQVTCSGKCVDGACVPASTTNVFISGVYQDPTAYSKILSPSKTPVLMGKWNIISESGSAQLDKITFHLYHTHKINLTSDETLAKNNTNVGMLYLVDAENPSVYLAESTLMPGGYAQFVKPGLLTLKEGQVKQLMLKAVINGSGIMEAASSVYWVLESKSSSDMMFSDMSGKILTEGQVNFVEWSNKNYPVGSIGAAPYLFHNAHPIMAAKSSDGYAPKSSQTKIFNFSVSNPGTRDLRLGDITFRTYGGSQLKGYKLWRENASGGLGMLISTSTVITSCQNGPCLDVRMKGNSYNFVEPGEKVFYQLTVDTTAVTSSVQISAYITGNAGLNLGDTQGEKNWGNGGVEYYYTPVGGKENIIPYTASDSYDVGAYGWVMIGNN